MVTRRNFLNGICAVGLTSPIYACASERFRGERPTFQEPLGSSGDLAMDENLAFGADHAHLQAPGVKVDSALELVLTGVEPHGLLLGATLPTCGAS